MNKPIDPSVFDDINALAALVYSKNKELEEEDDIIERAKKEVELLRIGRQIEEHSENKGDES